MASDLASQLQSLAAKAGVEPRRSKGQPSLLHDSKTAADIGIEDVYDQAIEGIETSRSPTYRELRLAFAFRTDQAKCRKF